MKIKQLKFEQVSSNIWRADTPLWDYKVHLHIDDKFYIPDVEPGVAFDTVEAAQRSCQEAFEAIINECMED